MDPNQMVMDQIAESIASFQRSLEKAFLKSNVQINTIPSLVTAYAMACVQANSLLPQTVYAKEETKS